MKELDDATKQKMLEERGAKEKAPPAPAPATAAVANTNRAMAVGSYASRLKDSSNYSQRNTRRPT
jgi:hypothetical protein